MTPTALWRGSIALLLIALTLIGVLIGVAWRRSHPRPNMPRLSVTFLNVGDGDCTLVRSPDGRTILLDAGSAQAGPVVVDALRRRNVKTIDLLMLTSPDETSIGGVPALLASGIDVSQVWDNPVADAGEARRDALEAIRLHVPRIPSSTANATNAIQVGQMLFVSAIWPPSAGPASRRDPLIFRINYGGTAFLFEAAATAEAERTLISQAGRKIECTGACTDMILQVAADAEGTPSPELLRRATPSVAVISCGPGSLPTQATLHRLEAAGAAVWQTDTQGTITVTASGRVSPTITATHL
jgi:competence protein ComEC